MLIQVWKSVFALRSNVLCHSVVALFSELYVYLIYLDKTITIPTGPQKAGLHFLLHMVVLLRWYCIYSPRQCNNAV